MQKGDVVEVDFFFPSTRQTLPHMVVVLSVKEVYDLEKTFVCVPISKSTRYDNEFSFPVDMNDFINPKGIVYDCAVRTQLVSSFHFDDITDDRGTKMKKQSFDRLMGEILENTFGIQ